MGKRERDESAEAKVESACLEEEGSNPNKPIRIYADGVYDLLHLGHMRQLEQAKKLFKHVHLIVGVASDEDTHRLKGPTVQTLSERAETLRHIRWVDDVVAPCPWKISPEFVRKYSIDYVAHDDVPYQAVQNKKTSKKSTSSSSKSATSASDSLAFLSSGLSTTSSEQSLCSERFPSPSSSSSSASSSSVSSSARASSSSSSCSPLPTSAFSSPMTGTSKTGRLSSYATRRDGVKTVIATTSSEESPEENDQGVKDDHPQIAAKGNRASAADAEEEDDIYGWLKREGRFKTTQRTSGVSTTDIIVRILQNYEDYVDRVLRRGVKPKELNIGVAKANSIVMKKNLQRWSEKVSDELTKVTLTDRPLGSNFDEGVDMLRNRIHEVYGIWRQHYQPFLRECFVEYFR